MQGMSLRKPTCTRLFGVKEKSASTGVLYVLCTLLLYWSEDKVCRICIPAWLVKEAGQRLTVQGQRLVLRPGPLHEYSSKSISSVLTCRLSRSVTALCLTLTVLPVCLPACVHCCRLY